MKQTILAIVTLIIGTTAFAQKEVSVRPRPEIKIVQWGGEGISLQVIHEKYPASEKITATATVHCGTGVVEKVILDGTGGFLGTGSFMKQPASNVRDARMIPEPMHVMGYAKKDVMTLIGIKDNDQTKTKVFILKKGSKGSVLPCR